MEHAVPFLQASNLPVATSCLQPTSCASANRSALDPLPVHHFESSLAPEFSQSRIDGRNGSNACTVIAALFVRCMLRNPDVQNVSVASLCEVIHEGNAVYDNLDTTNLLSADEVMAIQPSLGIQVSQESFVRASMASFSALIGVMTFQSRGSPPLVCGGIFVITPYSFALCCSGDQFILFDSHSHGSSGALLAVVPVARAVEYLIYFLNHRYPHLGFNANANNHAAAHMSFLSLVSVTKDETLKAFYCFKVCIYHTHCVIIPST